jgi:hypothetical protein
MGTEPYAKVFQLLSRHSGVSGIAQVLLFGALAAFA